jgi:hypothetical protein
VAEKKKQLCLFRTASVMQKEPVWKGGKNKEPKDFFFFF